MTTVTYTSHGTTKVMTYDGFTVTVGCTIASVPNPTAPSTGLEYFIYDSMLVIPLSAIPFTQTPPCAYPAVNSIAWTNPEPTVISFSADKLTVYVFTLNKTKLGDHTVVLANTITYGGATFTSGYQFVIKVSDPCTSTTLTTQAITTLSTNNGVTGTVDLTEVLDSQGTTRGQAGLCGARTYEIKTSADAAINWVTIAAKTDVTGTYTITAVPTLDEHATTNNLKLIVKLALYSGVSPLEIAFNVNVVTPPCECSRVGWTAPSLQTLTTTVKKDPIATLTISHGTVDAASLLLTPQIRACSGTCSSTTAISAIIDIATSAIPTFMTLNAGVLTVNSASNLEVMTYNLRVTMTTPDSGNQNFDTVKVVLGVCVITSLDAPTQPATKSYPIFAPAALAIDLSTPGFQ